MDSVLNVLNVAFFSVIVPILLISFLIFIHELGHYLAARWINAEIKEFAIGMGPKLFSIKSRKTNIVYALRAVPIGGALTVADQDESADPEKVFGRKPIWQRFIMISAGSFMNMLLGFIIMAVIVSGAEAFPSTRVLRFEAGATSNAPGGLLEGDRILRMNNKRVNVFTDVVYAVMRQGADPMRVTVMRDGERIVLEDVRFPTIEESSMIFGDLDFNFQGQRHTPGTIVHQTFFRSLSTVDMVWTSFFDLITGRLGMEAIAGPVGMTQVIGDSAREATEDRARGSNFLFLIAILTINLAVVNMLPLPALDGGRIVFLLIEFVRRKPLKPEYEGYVHLAGFALLLLFMIVVTYQDIVQLIAR